MSTDERAIKLSEHKETNGERKTYKHGDHNTNTPWLIPNHHHSYHSNPCEHRQELEEGSVQGTWLVWLESLGYEVVDGHVDEHAAGETHGDAVYPVRRWSLRRGVDGDPDADSHWAWYGEGQRVGHRRQERPLG